MKRCKSNMITTSTTGIFSSKSLSAKTNRSHGGSCYSSASSSLEDEPPSPSDSGYGSIDDNASDSLWKPTSTRRLPSYLDGPSSEIGQESDTEPNWISFGGSAGADVSDRPNLLPRVAGPRIEAPRRRSGFADVSTPRINNEKSTVPIHNNRAAQLRSSASTCRFIPARSLPVSEISEKYRTTQPASSLSAPERLLRHEIGGLGSSSFRPVLNLQGMTEGVAAPVAMPAGDDASRNHSTC
jgi:hypothetical protein